MIFKQVSEIVQGQKTQTRRVCKSAEYLRRELDGSNEQVRAYHHETGRTRLKWQVGRDYAVVPKRGAKTYEHDGQPLRIEITGIRQEPLQAISEADARAEGVADVAAYRALWESINTAPGVRWDDDPDVWVIEFRVKAEG